MILLTMKSRLRKTTHKYGIEIPKNVAHAMELKRENGNTMLMDALAKEMSNVGVAFEVKHPTPSVPHMLEWCQEIDV